MTSVIEPDLPSPWAGFLSEVDERLPAAVELHCLGGFVAAVCYGRRRVTGDVDYIEIAPRQRLELLQEIAGRESRLAGKYGLHFQYVAVASLPDSYAERLTEMFPGRFRRLRLWALEAHDLALSKLTRNSPIDREDVQYLAATAPLDPNVLAQRYRDELRPIVIGDPQKHDMTLALWLQAYFPKGSE